MADGRSAVAKAMAHNAHLANAGYYDSIVRALTSERKMRRDRPDKGFGPAPLPAQLGMGFLKDLYEAAMMPGNVLQGKQSVYAADPATGEVRTNPDVIGRAFDLASGMTLGAGAIPARGLELRSGMRDLKFGDLDAFLERIGVPFKRQESTSFSERHGQSPSTYYKLDDGTTIRASDHSYGENPLDFRYGAPEAVAQERILKHLGRPVPPEISQAAKAGRIAGVEREIANLEKLSAPNMPNRGFYKDAMREQQRLLDKLKSE